MKFFLSLIVMLYACVSLSLVPAWHDDLSLWTRVTIASPTLARGWLNLAYAISIKFHNMQPAKTYYEQARMLALQSHVEDHERRLVMAQADQALTLIIGANDPVQAGFYMDEAMRLWPEGFPMTAFTVAGPK